MQVVFLIGMMGSGKSHWGKQLAAYFKTTLVDLDKAIETKEQMTIAEIFSKKGEVYFRQTESAVLKQLIENGHQPMIVATGGGTPCFYDNMQWMNKNGLTIFINDSVSLLAQRVFKEAEHRPAIQGKTLEEVNEWMFQKHQERLHFYNQAKVILTDDAINLLNLIKAIENGE